MKKYLCEFLGTCILVLFGCGVAVLTKADLIATSLAFGLTIVATAYVIGNVSGCHINPAVTFAMWIDKRISGKDFIGYVAAQILGAIIGSALLVIIINSTGYGDFRTLGLGANGYGTEAASGITMLGALIVEIILTFVFVLSVLGVTKEKKNSSVAPIVIGLTLTLVHLLGIKLTGTSVNPARSIAPALFLRGDALSQVWVFIVGPLVGAAFAALVSFFIDLETNNKEVIEVFDIEKVEAEEMKNSRKEESVKVELVKVEEKKQPEKVEEKKEAKVEKPKKETKNNKTSKTTTAKKTTAKKTTSSKSTKSKK